jgi:magnesium transporter
MDGDRAIARALAEGHPGDAARVLERFDPERAAAQLREWVPAPAAAVLEQMMPESAAACLALLPAEAAGEALEQLDLDSVTWMLRRLPEPARETILQRTPDERRQALVRLLAHSEGTAGALMDPLVTALPDDLEVEGVLERFRRSSRGAFAYLYVVDRSGGLAGVTSLAELMTAPPDARVSSVMHTPVMRLHAGDGRRAIVAHPGWNEFHALPVTDTEGRFLGVVRYETLRRLDAVPEGTEAVSVAVSLGELYWLGLSGLVEGLGTVALRGTGSGRDER